MPISAARSSSTGTGVQPARPEGTWLPLPWRFGWDGIVAAAALLLAATAFKDLVEPWISGTVYTVALWIPLYLYVVVHGWRRLGCTWLWWIVRRQPALLLILALALLSAAWSVQPGVTLLYAARMAATTMVGVYIGCVLPLRQLMRVLFLAFTMLIVASTIAAVAFPSYGIQGHWISADEVVGAWKGIVWHKNRLGGIAAVAVVFFLVGTVTGRIPKGLGLALCALSVLTLVKSESATGLVVAGVGAAVAAGFALRRPFHLPALVVFLLVTGGMVLAAYIVVLASDEVVGLVGRDTSLTGRTEIWRDALRIIEARPLTGYGYAAVWGFGGDSYLPLIKAARIFPDAHNGYLQLATELGVPAALAAVAMLLTVMYAAARALALRSSPALYVAVVFAFMFPVANLVEVTLFGQSMLWVGFVMIAVAVERLTSPPGHQTVRHTVDGSRRSRRRRRRPSTAGKPGRSDEGRASTGSVPETVS